MDCLDQDDVVKKKRHQVKQHSIQAFFLYKKSSCKNSIFCYFIHAGSGDKAMLGSNLSTESGDLCM